MPVNSKQLAAYTATNYYPYFTKGTHDTVCIECVTCTLFMFITLGVALSNSWYWVENIHDIQGEFNKQQQSTTTKYYPYVTEGTHDSVHRVYHFHFVYVVLLSLGQCVLLLS